jgi:intraflagellar transport protein 172
MWEESRDFHLAIDEYLAVTQPEVSSMSELGAAWLKAVALADAHDKRRLVDVTETVAERLAQIGDWKNAGKCFSRVDRFKEAIDAFIKAEAWSEAREIPAGPAPQYRDYVEKAYKDFLARIGDADALEDAGDVDGAVAQWVKQGDWGKALEKASRNPSTYSTYGVQFLQQVMQRGFEGAVQAATLFGQFGAPVAPSAIGLYQHVVKTLLSADPAAAAPAVSAARGWMYKLVSDVKKSGGGGAGAEFDRLLLCLHYAHTAAVAAEAELPEVVAQLRVALLRFAGQLVPGDRAFFDAGIACRQHNWLSYAFVLLNRFLDLTEAIEDEDLGMVDNSDFTGTDIPTPYDMELPPEQSVPEGTREDVREWVLALSMDRKVEQELPTVACERCGSDTYAGGLRCTNCSEQFEACVASGFPVRGSQRVTCTACGSAANKLAWNALVLKTGECPWCGSSQSPVY